jgi:hypothetical protein
MTLGSRTSTDAGPATSDADRGSAVATLPERDPATPEPAVSEEKSPFADIKKLRLRNKARIESESGSISVTAGAPPNDKFFMCPPKDEWYLPAMVWVDPQDRRKVYYIGEGLWELSDLQGALKPVMLAPWMLADGTLGMWPISTREFGGADWRDSALEAVRQARTGWVRVQSDPKARRWRSFPPHEPLDRRDWPPDLSPEKFYERAFGKARLALTADHNLVRRLRGLPEV